MLPAERIRLRDGAMQWASSWTPRTPALHTEVFLVKSWIEHLRQHERVTISDRDIEEAARSFHVGPDQPDVTHLIAEPAR